MDTKPNIIVSFLRYNVVAVFATFVDFLVFVFLIEVINVWYIGATIIAAISGGIVAYFLNQNWVFMSKEGRLSKQAIKFFIVWGSSILLNTTGLYLIVENTQINEIISKIIVAVVVGLGFNFLMNKFYVFK